MMPNIAGSIILFNPDSAVNQNIETYLANIGHLYIFDNSPAQSIQLPEAIKNKASYYFNGANWGISKCLNKALELAQKDGYEYLLTMDQDSSFNNEEFKDYLYLVKEYEQKTADITIGCYGVSTNTQPKNDSVLTDQLLITSGSILNIPVALNLGGFDEKLFIDFVDHEFCLRLFANNYHTVLFQKIQLVHEFGTPKKVLSPLLKKENRKIYNPQRIYFMVRNFFYIKKRYHHLIKDKNLPFSITNILKNALLYNGEFVKTASSILKGYYDFLFKRMGG